MQAASFSVRCRRASAQSHAQLTCCMGLCWSRASRSAWPAASQRCSGDVRQVERSKGPDALQQRRQQGWRGLLRQGHSAARPRPAHCGVPVAQRSSHLGDLLRQRRLQVRVEGACQHRQHVQRVDSRLRRWPRSACSLHLRESVAARHGLAGWAVLRGLTRQERTGCRLPAPSRASGNFPGVSPGPLCRLCSGQLLASSMHCLEPTAVTLHQVHSCAACSVCGALPGGGPVGCSPAGLPSQQPRVQGGPAAAQGQSAAPARQGLPLHPALHRSRLSDKQFQSSAVGA